MKYPYKIYRLLSMEKLRGLCIQRDWYTNGDNEEYSHMLNMTKRGSLTSDDIVEIALDIVSHSDLEADDLVSVCDAILSCTVSFMV